MAIATATGWMRATPPPTSPGPIGYDPWEECGQLGELEGTGEQIDEVLIEIDEGVDRYCWHIGCQFAFLCFLECGGTEADIEDIFD